jgi:hypothetical protein
MGIPKSNLHLGGYTVLFIAAIVVSLRNRKAGLAFSMVR